MNQVLVGIKVHIYNRITKHYQLLGHTASCPRIQYLKRVHGVLIVHRSLKVYLPISKRGTYATHSYINRSNKILPTTKPNNDWDEW